MGKNFDAQLPPVALTPPFDFDVWLQLARTDPEGFEVMRILRVQDALARFRPEARPLLSGLLRQIEVERSRTAEPLDRVAWMMREMRRNLELISECCDECTRNADRIGSVCETQSRRLAALLDDSAQACASGH